MYILFITRGYPSHKYGTNGIFEFDQAKALINVGCKIVYAAIDVRSIRRWRKWGIEQFEKDGVNIMAINIPCGRLPRSIVHKISEIGLKFLFKLIVQRFGKPDILHAHFADYGFIASKLKKETRIPLVITEHSSEIIKPTLDKNLYKTARETYCKANALVSVSPALSEKIKCNYNLSALYIPDIVDIDVFVYRQRIASNEFKFISVGNLILRKRMDLTIEAFHMVFADIPNVTLTIFGEGEQRGYLEKLIIKYDLWKRVFLMGFCPRTAIAEKLAASDCFVLASRAETFGVAYVEALATGVPVIATKCGSVDVFVHKRNGVLVPVDNLKILAQAMRYMYKNARNYDNKLIAEEIRNSFSPAKVAEQLISIYKSLLIQ